MSKHSKIIKIVVLIELPDGSGVELRTASGKSLGRFVRLDIRQARLQRGLRQMRSADLAVASAVADRAKGSRGAALLTDRELAAATGLALPTVFRARNRLRSLGVLTWRHSKGGCVYQMKR